MVRPYTRAEVEAIAAGSFLPIDDAWRMFGELLRASREYLFRATPTGLWLADELANVFGVDERLDGDSAGRIDDHLEARLARPEFAPRALLARFNIELLATTDAATDTLEHHQRLRADGLGRVRPTFRPDAVVNIAAPAWRAHVAALGGAAGVDVIDYPSYVRAIERRRAFFKQIGALATDHAAVTPYTERLSDREADPLLQRALKGRADEVDMARFTAHMLVELARMSCEDGLVMQLHAGSLRNHHDPVFARFGPDTGADIPVATEWTRNLRPLLNAYGADSRFRLILFTLDESGYSRAEREHDVALRCGGKAAAPQRRKQNPLPGRGEGAGGGVRYVPAESCETPPLSARRRRP